MKRLAAELRSPIANRLSSGSCGGSSESYVRVMAHIPAASAYRDPVLGFRLYRGIR